MVLRQARELELQAQRGRTPRHGLGHLAQPALGGVGLVAVYRPRQRAEQHTFLQRDGIGVRGAL